MFSELPYLCISSGKSKLARVLRSSRLKGHRTMVDSYSRHLQTSQMLTLPFNLALSSFLLNSWCPFWDDFGPNRRSIAFAQTVLESTNNALFGIYDSRLVSNYLTKFLRFNLSSISIKTPFLLSCILCNFSAVVRLFPIRWCDWNRYFQSICLRYGIQVTVAEY